MAHTKNPASRASQGKNAHSTSKKKSILTIVIIVVVVVAVIAGVVAAIAAANWEEYRQYAADRKTVATCNGYDIPYEELRFVTLFYKDALASTHGSDIWDDPVKAETYRAELEALVQENLSQNYVVLSACRQLRIQTEGSDIDSYVDDQIQDLMDSFDKTAEYEAWLDEHWMTEHYLRFSIGVDFLESAIYYTLLDNDMFAYDLGNVADFMDYVENSSDYVRTIHVYIENVEGEDPAENLAKAQEISDILQAIADPEERRARMSEYIGSSINDDLQSITGDGYYFTRNEMVEEYEEAAFGLELGDVSEPIVCSGGNFVIMRLYPEEAYIAQNVQTLLNNYHSVAVGIYIDGFRPECPVVFNDYGNSIDLLTIE